MDASERMVVLGCDHSAGAALDALAAYGRALPAGVEWVRLPCGGGLDVLHILRAFESGADRVMVLACNDGACGSVEGNRWAERRVQAARRLLEEAGIPGWRLAFRAIAPTQAADLLPWIGAFAAFEPAADANASEDTR
ncbi:MAG TPA: hydrogenase iron-sulfur subunit [Chloroflexi bacterium]|jgi:F420-non-reducing hydrogenase iron-sulfur subunit|nr:hydrogenase iron-sulfur subunit [Chloroflexota bacterium]